MQIFLSIIFTYMYTVYKRGGARKRGEGGNYEFSVIKQRTSEIRTYSFNKYHEPFVYTMSFGSEINYALATK